MADTSAHAWFATQRPVASWRVWADIAQRWLALLGFLASLLDGFYGALGFGNLMGEVGDPAQAFVPHAIWGQVLEGIAVLLFVLGLIAASGWKAWVIPLALFGLAFFVQGLLIDLGFGGRLYVLLHVVTGILIIVGFGYLFGNRTRHPLSARGIRGRRGQSATTVTG